MSDTSNNNSADQPEQSNDISATAGNGHFKAGYVAVIGRPNVGKSTLINRLVGQKISIVTPKPQTTRQRVLGIANIDTKHGHTQFVFIDTPGIHANAKRALNKQMNRNAENALFEAHAVLWVIDATKFTHEDEMVQKRLAQLDIPVGVLINKVDQVPDKTKLFPLLEKLQAKGDFEFLVPASALRGRQLSGVTDELAKLLPDMSADMPYLYDPDIPTDKSERFVVAETIREKLMQQLEQELPYAVNVQIERFKDEPKLASIAAVIWVERQGQKGIVIGKGGQNLKQIGQRARVDMEKLLDKKVFLELFVKVRENWADDVQALRESGLEDN